MSTSTTEPAPDTTTTEPDGAKPDQLGEGGIKALAAERDARKALEKQLADLKTSQDAQTKALAEAFGIKTDVKSGETDVLTTLQQQMQALQHDNLVLRVAGESKITDPTDLALLGRLSSEDDMRKLAARLTPSAEPASGKPKPDRSAGSGSGRPDKGSVQAGADMFADRKKSTTTKE